MISSDMIRSTLDMLILSVLREEASYGYAISQQLSTLSGGIYEPKETTLYATIRRLEHKGFLISYPGSESAGRARTYYAITEAGSAQLAALNKAWHTTNEAVNRIIGASS